MITGNMEMGCAVDRLAGYRDALADHGLPYDLDLVREGDFHQPLAYEGACALLDLPDPPTAIFASNDISAFGAMDAIRDRGRRIPDDVSVIGFDDIPAASHVHPPLTTIRQPLYDMGRLATRMLLQAIEHPETPPVRKELVTELVVRASCRMPAGR